MKDMSIWHMFATKEQIEGEAEHQMRTREMLKDIIPRRKCDCCGAPAAYLGSTTASAKCRQHVDTSDSYNELER